MRIDEIMQQPLREMAYKKAKAEAIITGLEKPINLHLIKLIVVANSPNHAAHWRHELSTWLIDIADIRLNPSREPALAAFYWRILFDEPYGGNELPHVETQMRRLGRDYRINPEVESQTVLVALTDFHKRFSAGCATGKLDDAAIEAMVEGFGR